MFSANTAQHIVSVPTVTPNYQYVVVGGGGGGGGGGSFQTLTSAGAGGGAGGYLTGSATTPLTTLDIFVGTGGKGQFQVSTTSNPENGGESAIKLGTTYLVRALGGGFGAAGSPLNNWNNGGTGASAGGATSAAVNNRGLAGGYYVDQGKAGGLGALLTSARSDVGGGGGGGAGGAGGSGNINFGGSGGSGVFNSLYGLVCVGGTGGYTTNILFNGPPPSARGSGGSGGRYGTSTFTRTRGQDGASGVVIVAYPNKYLPANATGTFTYSEIGGNKVYTFTGPGTITF